MSNTKEKSRVNEFGDVVGKKEICQGTLLFLGILGFFTCACVRGCDEYRKHQTPQKVKITQFQNQR